MKPFLRRAPLGVGILAIVAAATLRWAGPGWFEHGPLHTSENLVATGSGTFLNLQAAGTPAPAPTNFEVVQRQVTACTGLKIDAEKAADCPAGHPRVGTGSIAAWDQLQTTCAIQVDPCPTAATIASAGERVAFDRDTGAAVPGFGESPKHPAGGLEFKFPFHTAKKTYELWDPTAQQVFPATFSGTATEHGLSVYHFTSIVSDADLGPLPQPLPGALFGGAPTAAPVTVHQHYTSSTVLSVEPTTGTPIDSVQTLTIAVRPVGGPAAASLPLIQIKDLRATPATVDRLADQARHDRRDVRLLEIFGPTILLVLGIVLVGAGLVLLRRTGGTSGR